MGKKSPRKNYEDHMKPYLDRIPKWRKLGASEEECAKRLGISYPSTWCKWKNKYVELVEAVKTGTQELVEDITSDGLYKRALGYSYEETKTFIEKKPDGTEIKKVEKTTKHLPPDVGAIIFSLCNLAPEKFHNPKQEHKVSGDKDNPLKLELIFENDYGDETD